MEEDGRRSRKLRKYLLGAGLLGLAYHQRHKLGDHGKKTGSFLDKAGKETGKAISTSGDAINRATKSIDNYTKQKP